MTDGIGRIFGGNNYGVGGYVPHRKEEEQTQTPAAPMVNYEETQVDPTKVMDFLNANNYFVAPANTTTPAELDSATVDRISGYMEKFEMIYGVVKEEFGEELAPTVMDLVMDRLMGMAA